MAPTTYEQELESCVQQWAPAAPPLLELLRTSLDPTHEFLQRDAASANQDDLVVRRLCHALTDALLQPTPERFERVIKVAQGDWIDRRLEELRDGIRSIRVEASRIACLGESLCKNSRDVAGALLGIVLLGLVNRQRPRDLELIATLARHPRLSHTAGDAWLDRAEAIRDQAGARDAVRSYGSIGLTQLEVCCSLVHHAQLELALADARVDGALVEGTTRLLGDLARSHPDDDSGALSDELLKAWLCAIEPAPIRLGELEALYDVRAWLDAARPSRARELLLARIDAVFRRPDVSAWLLNGIAESADEDELGALDLLAESLGIDTRAALVDGLRRQSGAAGFRTLRVMRQCDEAMADELLALAPPPDVSDWRELSAVLSFLHRFPRKGEAHVLAGLRSDEERVRYAAFRVLSQWPPDARSEPLRMALRDCAVRTLAADLAGHMLHIADETTSPGA
jgi:hypothetical protein